MATAWLPLASVTLRGSIVAVVSASATLPSASPAPRLRGGARPHGAAFPAQGLHDAFGLERNHIRSMADRRHRPRDPVSHRSVGHLHRPDPGPRAQVRLFVLAAALATMLVVPAPPLYRVVRRPQILSPSCAQRSLLNLLSACQNLRSPAEVDVGRDHVLERLMITSVIVVFHEARQCALKFPQAKVLQRASSTAGRAYSACWRASSARSVRSERVTRRPTIPRSMTNVT